MFRTDEQAPIPAVFDHLLQLGWDQREGSPAANAIYNCQMGRGRTTTGMVISTLLFLVRHQHLLPPSPEIPHAENISSLSLNDYESASEDSETERDRLLRGEYKLINQLLPALEHGKRAKRLLDVAIDRCAQIQNLREAIFDYKNRTSAEFKRGLNYLFR